MLVRGGELRASVSSPGAAQAQLEGSQRPWVPICRVSDCPVERQAMNCSWHLGPWLAETGKEAWNGDRADNSPSTFDAVPGHSAEGQQCSCHQNDASHCTDWKLPSQDLGSENDCDAVGIVPT